MGIKIVDEGNTIVAKGNTAGTNVAYFFAILFFIVGGIMIISGYLGATILAIIGTILIYAGAHHTKNARLKKLREYQLGYTSGFRYRPEVSSQTQNTPSVAQNTPRVSSQTQNTPTSIKCSNCGNQTGALNKFCPNCGTSLEESARQEKYEEELEEARRKLEEDQKHLAELERKRGLKDTKDTNVEKERELKETEKNQTESEAKRLEEETESEKIERYRRLGGVQRNIDNKGYVEDKEEKVQKKSKDLTAGLQDASNIAYGASYVTDVQTNSDNDTYNNDDDYDDED